MPFDSQSPVNESPVLSSAEGLGRSLRATRRASGLTQRSLAGMAQVDLATLRALESGRGTVMPLLAVLDTLDHRISAQPADVEFGRWVAGERKSAGFSQQALATRIGVSKPTIIQIERGRGNLRSLVSVFDALSISLEIAPRSERQHSRVAGFVIFDGDNLDHLKGLPDNSIDSVVTDPPYGIDYMKSEWDGSVPGIEVWKEVFRVLKPGGFLLSFGGTRTYHRMVVAVEDAGFEIRDQISWLYGQGMPKSRNVSKDIDRIQGAKRDVVGRVKMPGYARIGAALGVQAANVTEYDRLSSDAITDDAKKFSGHGNGLKPAQEPIVVARKPFTGSIARNLIRHGVGTFNIDACRVPGVNPMIALREAALKTGKHPGRPGRKGHHNLNNCISFERYAAARESEALGRFPSNIIHDGSAEAMAVFPKETASYFYCAKPSPEERADNKHPTVKPLALMSYLVKLVTPAGGTVLDPFAGSGTTGVAALADGFSAILMERDSRSLTIIRRRMHEAEAKVGTVRHSVS